jgi:signal transduction histidine kinase
VVTNLVVQLELALAELGLGNVDTAKQQLDKLLVEHQPNDSPVTLGALHEARARVALRESLIEEARSHLAQMESHYQKTGAVTLLDLVDNLRREIDRGDGTRGDEADEAKAERPQHVMLRVQLMLSQSGDTLAAERAEKSLQVALELSSADEGFLVLANHHGEPVAHLGNDVPSPELVQWAEQNMLDAAVDEQTVMTDNLESEVESNYKVVGFTRYCVVPLWAKLDREDCVVAALVLGFENRVPRIPDPSVMRAIAMHLAADPGMRSLA